MKILFLIPNDILGGAEQYLKMIADYYKTEEVDIIFFRKTNSSSLWSKLSNDTNQIFMSNKSESNGIIKYWFKLLFNKRQSYDYIFTSHVSTNAFTGLMLSLKILKTKHFIARESTTVFTRFKGLTLARYKLLYKFGYKKIDMLICQTNKMKNQLLQYFPQIENRTNVNVIPNPINIAHIEEMSKTKAGIIMPKEFLVSAGRLIELKGFDLLIESLAKLKKDYPNLKLVILGKGNLINDLESQAKTLGLEKDVIFAGHVNNVYPYFREAKVCVVSSRIEGFPNVLLQMMSQNNNIVSTMCAGGIDKIPHITAVKTDSLDALYQGVKNRLEDLSNSANKIHEPYLRDRDINNFMDKIKKLTNKDK